MATETQTLHFTIGEDFGILIATIAQEHLIYNYNPKKAVGAITDSLMGCPEDLALQILKGDMVILVDVENQDCIITERQEIHENIYPKLNIREWYQTQARLILSNGISIKDILDIVLGKLRFKSVHFSIDYKDVFKFLANGNKEKLYDFIDESEEVSELEFVIKITKEFIEKSLEIQKVMDWIRKTYPDEFEGEDFYIPEWREYSEIVMTVMNKFQAMAKMDLSELQTENEDVEKFIESAIEIGNVLSKGIEPVDIMQNYSAGWLSPDGKYYALNGEIANMLHNQIATALYEAGIVEQSEENENNPDAWLEQQGWVKIHGDNINFAGCLNDKIGLKNINMTNVQVETIEKYIQVCHGGVMCLGWRMEKVSAAKFEMMADNMDYMNEKYFQF